VFFAPAYQTVLVLVVLLILTFILLLSYTFWTRIKKGYWHRYREKFRKSYSAKLFRFVEEAESPSDADVLIKSLTKRTKDISFFLELITEMSDLLRGDDHKKLTGSSITVCSTSFIKRSYLPHQNKNRC